MTDERTGIEDHWYFAWLVEPPGTQSTDRLGLLKSRWLAMELEVRD